MTNAQLLELSRRLRSKGALLLDADIDFAQDLLMASFVLEDLLASRQAISTKHHTYAEGVT
jgi:hypothetical protein